MGLYPIFADLTGLPVLVVGGGHVAERKIAMLLAAGARVRVGAPMLTPALLQQVEEGRIERLDGTFEPAWLDGAWLAIAATDDHELNARVAAARKNGAFWRMWWMRLRCRASRYLPWWIARR